MMRGAAEESARTPDDARSFRAARLEARQRQYAGRTSGFDGSDVASAFSAHVLPAYRADVLPAYSGQIDSMAKDEDVVRQAILAAWGIGVPLGRNFPCLLPGHLDRASVYRDPQSGVWKYRCWGRDDWWVLAEVCAAVHAGRIRHLNDGERCVWYRRLWQDAGLLEPVEVRFPSLDADAATRTLQVLRGLGLLLGLRWLTHPGEPTLFTRAFGASWCNVAEQAARTATLDLLQRGVIREVGEHVDGVRRSRLLLPGIARIDTEGHSR